MTYLDLRPFIGRRVVIGTPRSMGDGALTLRWGTLRAVTPTDLLLDGFEDSAGIGAYVGGSYRHDGVTFPRADVVTIKAAR